MLTFGRIYRFLLKREGYNPVAYEALNPYEPKLRITFKTEASVNSVPSQGEVVIYNLSTADLSFLATNYHRGTGALIPSHVQLEAGYADNLYLILRGNIIEATPDFSSPDTSIKLKIMSAIHNNVTNPYAPCELGRNSTYLDLAKAVASANKLTLEYEPSLPDFIIGAYSLEGPPLYQISLLASLRKDVVPYVHNDKLTLVHENQGKVVKYTISSDNGMIGSIVPASQGCEVKTLLMPYIHPGDLIQVKSLDLPQLNSTYRIQMTSHTGDSHGNDWYSHFKCIRPNL